MEPYNLIWKAEILLHKGKYYIGVLLKFYAVKN